MTTMDTPTAAGSGPDISANRDAELAEGFLFLHDGVEDMIVSGGENVYPAEVENVLMRHPDVSDVAVIGVPDERWGEAVKAIVVPAAGATVTGEDVIACAREHLAGPRRRHEASLIRPTSRVADDTGGF